MKVLTVKQPWASLIINGIKEYEFRSWKTNYRGKILIHAGLSSDKEYIKKCRIYNLDYINGAIIGEVEIEDCILVEKEFDGELSIKNPIIYGHNHVGNYAWKLKNVKIYKEPIFIKGKLGLWNYEEK